MAASVLRNPTAARSAKQEAISINVARRRRFDSAYALLGFAATLVGLVTLTMLIVDLARNGIPVLDYDFFTSFPSRRATEAGILSAWVGTLLVMLVTALIAVPLGVAAGLYLEEYAPRNLVTRLIEINVTNLAAVPSIIYGLLALGLFVYLLGLGRSVLTAGLTLALLILPIVIVTTREAVRSVPFTIREAAYAVGASRWQVTRDHVVPYAMPGIATGMIIGLARAIGETAPLITIGALSFIAFLPAAPVTGEFPWTSFQWLSDPFTVMPIQMFNWVSRPGTAFHAKAAATGLVLLVMTLAMNAGAIYLRYRVRRMARW